MKTDKHRLFIGIPFDDTIRGSLETQVVKLKPQFPKKLVTWIPKENYHVTLLFLGSVIAEKIPEIQSTLSKTSESFVPFSIEINGIMLFPNSKHPKIIAAKIALTEQLGKLYATLHQEMTALDLKLDERPYIPHVTLGRIKHDDPGFRFAASRLPQTRSPGETKWNPGIQFDPGFHFAASRLHFVLFESLQTATGTHYEILIRP